MIYSQRLCHLILALLDRHEVGIIHELHRKNERTNEPNERKLDLFSLQSGKKTTPQNEMNLSFGTFSTQRKTKKRKNIV